MSEPLRAFLGWASALMGLFIAINVLTLLPHDGKVHRWEWPFPVAEWIEIGECRSETESCPEAILCDILAGAAFSVTVAAICGLARSCHSAGEPDAGQPAPKAGSANEPNQGIHASGGLRRD